MLHFASHSLARPLALTGIPSLKIDPGFGWVDFGISIDIAAIIEYLKGNG